MKNKAVFLDRDGVIVVPDFREGRSFAVRSMKDFNLYKDAQNSLNLLKQEGFLLVVVTNQPDVGEGLISLETLGEMNRFLFENLPIDDIWFCPHSKKDNCLCRKPKPGLLLGAADTLNIDFKASYMIGDRGSDVQAGNAVGCKTIFIDLDYTSEQKSQNPDFSCRTLLEAVVWIIDHQKHKNIED